MTDDFMKGPDPELAAQVIRERNRAKIAEAPAVEPPRQLREAWKHSGTLQWLVNIYLVLGIFGSLALIVGESTRFFGFASLLATCLTAACATALVHMLRVLVFIADQQGRTT